MASIIRDASYCHATSDVFAAKAVGMRRSLITVLVALLIAIFAIGAPIPAKAADCSGSGDCNVGMNQGSCDLKGEPCKFAQNCAGQVLKMPAQAWFRVALGDSKVAFAIPANDDLSSASITPEISPPRA
jgi:hypothetical protein